jgi:hypothetical protein
MSSFFLWANEFEWVKFESGSIQWAHNLQIHNLESGKVEKLRLKSTWREMMRWWKKKFSFYSTTWYGLKWPDDFYVMLPWEPTHSTHSQATTTTYHDLDRERRDPSKLRVCRSLMMWKFGCVWVKGWAGGARPSRWG